MQVESLREFHVRLAKERTTYHKKHIVHMSTQSLLTIIWNLYQEGNDDMIPDLMWQVLEQRYLGE